MSGESRTVYEKALIMYDIHAQNKEAHYRVCETCRCVKCYFALTLSLVPKAAQHHKNAETNGRKGFWFRVSREKNVDICNGVGDIIRIVPEQHGQQQSPAKLPASGEAPRMSLLQERRAGPVPSHRLEVSLE